MCICMYTHTHVYVYTGTCIYTHLITCVLAYMHINVSKHTHPCIHNVPYAYIQFMYKQMFLVFETLCMSYELFLAKVNELNV